MTLLTLNEVSLAYGHHPLLDHVSFEIAAGERVCLIGRNGAGKSTLFRVLSGKAQPDDGKVWRRDTLRVSHLEQEVPLDIDATIYDAVSAGLGDVGRLLGDYHRAAQRLDGAAPGALAELSALQQQIETRDGWNLAQQVETVLSRLDLPPDQAVNTCSGGVRRRVMLAQALVSAPDLLLLDEPTNHMDIKAIDWLEDYLLSFRGALIFITHDRTFLRRLATRLIELDRGRLTSFPGDYANYLRRKDEMLAAEEQANARFDRKLAEHEVWIRQGIKARRTRNEGRVNLLEQMRRERAGRIDAAGKASLAVDAGEASGRRVVDLRHVSFSYGGRCIVRDFSTSIVRGDRIGIMGPNGSGKSTLLKLILGELSPDSGDVVHGSRLQIAYFDQQRELLDPDKTVRDNISEGSDFVEVRGRPRHVVGYLKDFLFPPERIDAPVRILSGGERNRLLLARLFTKPANMLVLDEPTNDLDVDTLELLEDLLSDYDGTLLIVSHDRSFLDNLVTSTIMFEGGGHVSECVGGYEDWLRQRRPPPSPGVRPAADKTPRALPAATHKAAATTPAKRKLSFAERRELEALPGRIEALEQEQRQLEQEAGSGEFYQQDKAAITAALARLEELGRELQLAYDRWESLDKLGSE
ncbi:MAG: ATP-binding cassette domain-containing protein [Gammaproteobacteria bacterium]|nr:ATP-binding cassette domain-containing protein [Gammaproteobacteria bacterium]